eukprot:4158314-Pleurochrysis_carterae.AAC.1
MQKLLPSYIERLAKALKKDEEDYGEDFLVAGGGCDLQVCKSRDVMQDLSSALLMSVAIDFDWQVGSRGFHRAETVNILWPEFSIVFNGISDLVAVSKNRYEGALLVEKVNHIHSGYGPFCMAGAKSLPAETGAVQVLEVLLGNLDIWLLPENWHYRGTCVVCAVKIFNLVANAAYWSQMHILAKYSSRAATPAASSAAAPADSTASSSKASTTNLGIIPAPTHWFTHSRPQTGYVMPLIKREGRLRAGVEAHVYDYVVVNFDREKIPSPSAVENKMAKMAFKLIWPIRQTPSGPFHVRITADGQESFVDPARVVSHIKKRGASQQIAWLGAPMPVVQKLCKHQNVQTSRVYMEGANVDLNPFRQLLNAPPGLAPSTRAFSNLDIYQRMIILEQRMSKQCLQQSVQTTATAFQLASSGAAVTAAATQFAKQMAEIALQVVANQPCHFRPDLAPFLQQAQSGVRSMQHMSNRLNSQLARACDTHKQIVDSNAAVIGLVGTRINPGAQPAAAAGDIGGCAGGIGATVGAGCIDTGAGASSDGGAGTSSGNGSGASSSTGVGSGFGDVFGCAGTGAGGIGGFGYPGGGSIDDAGTGGGDGSSSFGETGTGGGFGSSGAGTGGGSIGGASTGGGVGSSSLYGGAGTGGGFGSTRAGTGGGSIGGTITGGGGGPSRFGAARGGGGVGFGGCAGAGGGGDGGCGGLGGAGTVGGGGFGGFGKAGGFGGAGTGGIGGFGGFG